MTTLFIVNRFADAETEQETRRRFLKGIFRRQQFDTTLQIEKMQTVVPQGDQEAGLYRMTTLVSEREGKDAVPISVLFDSHMIEDRTDPNNPVYIKDVLLETRPQ